MENDPTAWGKFTGSRFWFELARVRVIGIRLHSPSDINECRTMLACGKHGKCTNKPGSFECTCHKGYKQDGKFCRSKSEYSQVEHLGKILPDLVRSWQDLGKILFLTNLGNWEDPGKILPRSCQNVQPGLCWWWPSVKFPAQFSLSVFL